jgi:hypothetical protein
LPRAVRTREGGPPPSRRAQKRAQDGQQSVCVWVHALSGTRRKRGQNSCQVFFASFSQRSMFSHGRGATRTLRSAAVHDLAKSRFLPEAPGRRRTRVCPTNLDHAAGRAPAGPVSRNSRHGIAARPAALDRRPALLVAQDEGPEPRVASRELGKPPQVGGASRPLRHLEQQGRLTYLAVSGESWIRPGPIPPGIDRGAPGPPTVRGEGSQNTYSNMHNSLSRGPTGGWKLEAAHARQQLRPDRVAHVRHRSLRPQQRQSATPSCPIPNAPTRPTA